MYYNGQLTKRVGVVETEHSLAPLHDITLNL